MPRRKQLRKRGNKIRNRSSCTVAWITTDDGTMNISVRDLHMPVGRNLTVHNVTFRLAAQVPDSEGYPVIQATL